MLAAGTAGYRGLCIVRAIGSSSYRGMASLDKSLRTEAGVHNCLGRHAFFDAIGIEKRSSSSSHEKGWHDHYAICEGVGLMEIVLTGEVFLNIDLNKNQVV